MNYGDKHTEDSLSSRLGRFYGIRRGLDCGPNILMSQYRDENGWVTNFGVKKNGDFAENTKPIFCISQKTNICTRLRLKLA
jgi:hypothetical protein